MHACAHVHARARHACVRGSVGAWVCVRACARACVRAWFIRTWQAAELVTSAHVSPEVAAKQPLG
eukprot:13271590-Alexandrium_andersonii.AAC.1